MRSALSRLLGCVICGTVVCAHPMLSQRPSADSTRAVQAARKAQSAFESFRQSHLPRFQPGANPPCDEQVGRFCYWHNEDDPLVPEPDKIARAREELIEKLDRYVALAPRDDWITGQRVRYLVEAGYDSSAFLAARECQATPWWCQALRGYSLHAMRRYAEAESTFDSVLTALPPDERCRWTDLSLLLSDSERERYTRIPCSEREEFESRFWQLADPSYVVAGNDRKTEHFSRIVLTKLLEKSANAYGLTWGDDIRELVIRYGAPVSYTTSWPSTYSLSSAPITGHEREPCFHFVALYAGSDSTRWELRAPRARERYSPPYIDSFTHIPAQFAMFKRGDSALVVVAFADSGLAPTVMGLAGESKESLETSETAPLDETTSPDTSSLSSSSSSGQVRFARTAWRGIAVGIEQFDEQKRHIAQHRAWLAPPARAPNAPQLSTLLLFTGEDTSSSPTLDAAAKAALTTKDLQSTRKLGVYWEMYDMVADSVTNTLPVSITVSRIDGGFGRWLAQALRLTQRDMPIGVGWREASGVQGVLYKSIVLDLSQLPRGTYQIEVAVGEPPYRSTTSREFRLR
jgi:hypothetical protein